MRVHIVVVAVVIGFMVTSPGRGQDATRSAPVADSSQWIADVDELLTILRREHPNMNRTHTDAQWRAAADALKQSLPDSTVEEAVWG